VRSVHGDSDRLEEVSMPEASRQYFEDIQVGDEYLSPGRTIT
jgi:hypothetical protein